MTTYFQKKVWLGFLTAISLIAWLAYSTYVNNEKFDETSKAVAHTNHVLFCTEQLLSAIIDFESGQRGYSLTGSEEFLASSQSLQGHVDKLLELTSGNESQQVRIKRLKRLVHDKVDFIHDIIEARKKSFEEARTLNASLVGKKLTDDIRHTIQEIQQEENSLLQTWIQRNEKDRRHFYHTFIALLFTVVLILILVFYSIYASLKARSRTEASLRTAMEQIKDVYDNAPCGYHSVNASGLLVEINNTWLQWLRYSREDVLNRVNFSDLLTRESVDRFSESFDRFKKEGSIKDLEFDVIRKDGSVFPVLLNATAIYDNDGNFVKSRSTAIDYTAQRKALEKIEQLNKELESFSYSVSHDLRAPLRSIDGYTQILMEDYAGKLDEEGKRILNVVVNNSRKMARLIDDLLDFARVGRKDMDKVMVNVEGLIDAVFSEIKAAEGERDIKLSMGHIEPCYADPNLLRQVWWNLLANAVKYTRKKEQTVIFISSAHNEEEIVYSIKDNGTGFDMQYAHKLFGVFQRLHRQQDFEGTGVGLAIVHRIVTRHGGRVWAEGKVNEGAIFYFSLPK